MGKVIDIWPHDLLTFATGSDFISSEDSLPNWAQDSISQAKIAVVRRGPIKSNLIPVGLRGYERNQRLAGYLSKEKIVKQYHPWDFIENKSWKSLPMKRQKMLPFQALSKIVPYLKKYQWGISGSLAYEMATGVIMVKDNSEHISDLDIIMTDKVQLNREEARTLLKQLNQFGIHADVQVVHGQNGFSLEEYAQNRDQRIMVKTAAGPILAGDPWKAVKQ